MLSWRGQGENMTDTISYPRIYRSSLRMRSLLTGYELVLVAIAAACIVITPQIPPKWPLGGWLFAVFPMLPAALSVPSLISAWRGKLVLFADRIEYTGVFATRVVYGRDIRETREAERRVTRFEVTLVCKDGRKIKISDFGQMDEALAEWIDSFPNAEDMAEAAAAVLLLANPAFGRTEDERRRNIVRDAEWIDRIKWIGMAVGTWGLFYPHPPMPGACTP